MVRLLQGERARLTITSPPYNLGHSASLGNNRSLGRSKYLGEDRRTTAQYGELLCSVTENALAISDVVIVNVQMLSGNKIALLEWLYHFRNRLIDIAIWDKGTTAPAMARNIMNSRFEFLVYLTTRSSKGKTPRTLFTANFRGTVDNIYQGRQQKHNPYFQQHAATFPLHLPIWLMQTFDAGSGLIFDPFLGTGTTLMAAHHTGRRCVGMEIEPSYCDLILQRFEQEADMRPVQILGHS